MTPQEALDQLHRDRLQTRNGQLYNSTVSQRVRFESIIRLLPRIRGTSLLDVGCGAGDFLAFLAHWEIMPSEYLGLDCLGEAVAWAQARYAGKHLGFGDIAFRQSSDYLDNPADVADHVVLVGVAECRFDDDPAKVFETAMRWFLRAYEDCRIGCAATFMTANLNEHRPACDAPVYPGQAFDYLRPKVDRLLLDDSYAPHVFTIAALRGPRPFDLERPLENAS